jgi:small subunit ribosomal protein S21
MSITLVSVQARQGEEIQSLLKRFKRKVEASAHIIELRERKEYKKPSVVKREKMNKVLYKVKKEKQMDLDRERGITRRKKTK